jgi:gas vesicle protein
MQSNREPALSYLVVGVGLGLLAGLLWTPRPGKETRKELRRGANDGLEYLNEETEKIRTHAERCIARIKERFGGLRRTVGRDETSRPDGSQ